MKKGMLRKVQRLEKFWVTRKTREGIRKYGPYWRGAWYEDGRDKTVHLGKEVPKSLQYLVAGRYKRSGYKTYTWPGKKKKGGD